MSIITEKTVKVPSNINIELEQGNIILSSELGQIIHKIHPYLEISILNKSANLRPKKNLEVNLDKKIGCLLNTEYNNIKNKIKGVSKGYRATLNLKGV